MYAIQNSKVELQSSSIRNNAGLSSSVLYGLANIDEESLKLRNCEISENVAYSMTFYLTTTDLKVDSCSFLNNRS